MKPSFKFLLALLIVLTTSQPIYAQEVESELKPPNVSLSFNGTFIFNCPSEMSKVNSNNGRYWCNYDIGAVKDETRELKKFQFYENNQLRFTLEKAPGSDLYISNSASIAFMDMTHHYKSELTIRFYSKTGSYLFSETIVGASLFGFSATGNKFGVGNVKKLLIISIPDHDIETYPGGDQFDISEDENLVAIARRDKAQVYANKKLLTEFKTGFVYPRKVRVSSEFGYLAIIDKRNLKVFSRVDGRLLFTDVLKGKNSYRDLILNGNKILTGIHHRERGLSQGILKVYSLDGQVLLEQQESIKEFKTFNQKTDFQGSFCNYKQIPWPFLPFDSVHTIWNYYEQHMSYGQPDWSYLHQGLDIIVPMNEPTFAVEDGMVKCVLTISGYMHWRTAISKEQTAALSKGWLYAHLIQNTIQFDVGDTVQRYDYLGDIIQWEQDWGHIHFVEIQDSGLVWRYDDNEWGITYNPLLSLRPHTDLIPPAIESAISDSKFAFCLNESSVYLDPDSLYGDIDIIAKITDYIDDSPWQLPAYETYYWVKKLPEDTIVFPRTLGQVLNHPYNFYSSNNYTPYATLIYKRDDLLVPSSWMDTLRNYYHILTNNNGDSLIDLSEKDLAFSTTDFLDGDYRILVEARDQYGNATIDSMAVKFNNGLSGVSADQNNAPFNFLVRQNYPNPFNAITKIIYSVPKSGNVTLKIYDVIGREVNTLVNGFQPAGTFTINFIANDLASGIYFYKFNMNNFSDVRKMILMH